MSPPHLMIAPWDALSQARGYPSDDILESLEQHQFFRAVDSAGDDAPVSRVSQRIPIAQLLASETLSWIRAVASNQWAHELVVSLTAPRLDAPTLQRAYALIDQLARAIPHDRRDAVRLSISIDGDVQPDDVAACLRLVTDRRASLILSPRGPASQRGRRGSWPSGDCSLSCG